jgi:hypothetical protein
MKGMLTAALLILAVAVGTIAVELEVERSVERLTVRVALSEALPDDLEAKLSSGGKVTVQYLVRIYSPRWLINDRRMWKGAADSIVSFDAITGRYQCQLIVNGTTTTSRETDSAADARAWLQGPPAIEVPIPKSRRDAFLRVRARAVFSRGTTWLVFPTANGTRWTEVGLEPPETAE